MSYILPRTLTEEALRSSGIHFGVKSYVTKDMKDFVVEITSNGNPIFDLNKILQRIETTGKMIATYNHPVLYATDARFTNALKSFTKMTGITSIQGRLVPGTFTNSNLEGYIDADIVVISDPSLGFPKPGSTLRDFTADRRVIQEATAMQIPVVGICNSNATLEDIDVVIPANNASKQAIAVTYYLLARSVLFAKHVPEVAINASSRLENFETEQVEAVEEE